MRFAIMTLIALLGSCQNQSNRAKTFASASSESVLSLLPPYAIQVNKISDLPELPKQIFEEHSSYTIAGALLENKRQRVEIPRANAAGAASGFDLKSSLRIMMAVPPVVVDKIVANGFLNAHQTGTGAGWGWHERAQELRTNLEEMMVGYRFPRDETVKAKIFEVLPKYAYAVPNGAIEKLGPTKVNLKRYGGLIFSFKDSVKDRSTLTFGNSLSGATIKSFVEAPNEEAGQAILKQLASDQRYSTKTSGVLNKPPLVTFSATSQFWSGFPTSKLSTAALPESDQFVEAQIWGPLTIDDVKYVLRDCPGSEVSIAEVDVATEHLKNANIPVFKCKVENVLGVDQMVQGEQIH